MRLDELMVAAADGALAGQEPTGEFPGGHNGPYHDPETPVRVTAHWAVALEAAHRLSGEARHAEAAAAAVGYLLSRPARPVGAAFHCRRNPEKDLSNGLIGQAWAIEALTGPGVRLGVAGSREAACEVAGLHPFDEDVGLWRRVNVDGSYRGYDLAFNHQLWFAAALASIDPTAAPRITARVDRFLDAVGAGLLRTARDGRVIHAIPDPSPARRAAAAALPPRGARRRLAQRRQRVRKEIGYQAFNLHAFATLRRLRPDHGLWESSPLRRALGYARSPAFLQGLADNEFAFPYNPPGFEVPWALVAFGLADRDSPEVAHWVRRQIDHGWDAERRALVRGATDERTAAARIYEAVPLLGLDRAEARAAPAPMAGEAAR